MPAEEDAALRALYRESHPGAYWADFGDFKMYRFKACLLPPPPPPLGVSALGGDADSSYRGHCTPPLPLLPLFVPLALPCGGPRPMALAPPSSHLSATTLRAESGPRKCGGGRASAEEVSERGPRSR